MILCCEINKCIIIVITVIIPQTIIVPTKSIIVASLCDRVKNLLGSVKHTTHLVSVKPTPFNLKSQQPILERQLLRGKKNYYRRSLHLFFDKSFFFSTRLL